MITSWDVYWITRLDSIGVFLFLVMVAFFFLGCIFLAKDNVFSKITIACFAISFLIGIISVFSPSTKECAMIYLIPKIANNEQIQKVPDNAARLLNAKMEEWINDTVKIKKEEKK